MQREEEEEDEHVALLSVEGMEEGRRRVALVGWDGVADGAGRMRGGERAAASSDIAVDDGERAGPEGKEGRW